jgi:hypothetical protein
MNVWKRLRFPQRVLNPKKENVMKNRNTREQQTTRGARLVACAMALGMTFTVALLQAAQDDDPTPLPQPVISVKSFIPPAVFQAAGPKIASIQSTVDHYRAELGDPNNGNQPGPLASGRREINWDGGGSADTSLGPTPFTLFLNSRGARMTTPGTGFVQAPLDGLVTTFGNPTYADIFQPFSLLRLFSPIESRVTVVDFFLPGSNGSIPAGTTGFGLVLTDVDQPEGSVKRLLGSTVIEYFDVHGRLLYKGFAPASPGDASVTFFGVVFEEPVIARVRIRTGDEAPGLDDARRRDIVMMDDFIYGEPVEIQ